MTPGVQRRGQPRSGHRGATAAAGGSARSARARTDAGWGQVLMAVTAADVKALRERTGAPIVDVKKALEEAEGDDRRPSRSSARRAQPPPQSAVGGVPPRASSPPTRTRAEQVSASSRGSASWSRCYAKPTSSRSMTTSRSLHGRSPSTSLR